MTVDNGVAANGDTFPTPNVTVSLKKSGENERRRRRRNKKGGSEVDVEEGNVSAASDSKENADPQLQVSEEVVVEYVPEFEDGFDDEFRNIFDKFNFRESVASEEDAKKCESEEKADVKKKLDEEDQDNQNKEKGISNRKKKLQRRMKIAELKQVSARPDVVEVWDATSADPKLLVFLKSYRNTVPVPRHWSQKRKYLQGNICDNHEAWTCSTPTGIETPDAIELRKEPDRPLYQVLEEKSENIAPGTLLGTSHTYVIKTGTQEKTGAKREAREEEKLRNRPESFSDMVVENELKRRRKTHDKEGKKKKKDFKL